MMIKKNFEKYYGKDYVEKGIAKASKITEDLASIVNENVNRDFNMVVELGQANIFDVKRTTLRLLKDGKYIASILNTTVKEPHIYIIRENSYVKSKRGNVYIGNKTFNDFKLTLDNVISEFDELYLSEVFTTLIEIENYITIFEPSLKEEKIEQDKNTISEV